jgi:hypothetical protein
MFSVAQGVFVRHLMQLIRTVGLSMARRSCRRSTGGTMPSACLERLMLDAINSLLSLLDSAARAFLPLALVTHGLLPVGVIALLLRIWDRSQS